MVKFELFTSENGTYTYHYYPEGDFTSEPGVIELNLKTESIYLVKLADRDFERYVTAEERNSLIKSLNDMIAEEGGNDFEEYVTEGYTRRFYADQAISGIIDGLEKGNPPENGMRAWY
ncbi:hypothetical protein HCC47_07295 [Streptococcus suis]|nr:hypothetical protein [Streptococcus suis]